MQSRRDIRGILARGAGAAFILNAIGTGIMYASHILLARWMGGESEYGEYALAYSWAQMLGFCAGAGLPIAALRFVPEYLEKQEHGKLAGVIRASWIVSLIGGLLLALVGTGITYLTAPVELRTPLLIGLWVSPLLSLTNFYREVARGAKRIAFSIWPTQVMQPALLIVAAGLWILFSETLTSSQGAGFLFITTSAALLVQIIGIHKIMKGYEAGPPEYAFRTWLNVAIPLLLVQESLVILRQTDIVMLGFFFGDDTGPVGQYNAAARTATLGRFVLLALNSISAPMIAGLFARGDHHGLAYMTRTATRWVFWPSLAITIALAVMADPVLRVFGEGFVEAKAALWILLGAQMIGAAFGPVGHLLKLTGHHGKSMHVYGWTVLVNIALNLGLIPLYGMNGAAMATGATIVLRNVWAYVLVRKHLKIHSFAFFRIED